MHRSALIMSLNSQCLCVTLSILLGMCLFYCGCTHCKIMQGTINKFVRSAVSLPTRESSRLLSLGSTRGVRWAEETGCNFWALWLSEEISTSKAAGGSQAVVFTLTTQSVEVRCCWCVCFLTSYCIKCCCEACLHLPLRMPRRWCLHHSGQCVSSGWKCGESACWNEGTGQGGL